MGEYGKYDCNNNTLTNKKAKLNRFISGNIIIFIIFTLLSVRIYAGNGTENSSDKLIAYFTIGNNKYLRNNEFIEMDVEPFISDSRSFVPVRYLSEAIDIEVVKWEESTRKVFLQKGELEIVLQIEKKFIMLKGKRMEIDTAPIIRDGRTFLPARYVAESFGYKLGWDSQQQNVLVYGKSNSITQKPSEGIIDLQDINNEIDIKESYQGTANNETDIKESFQEDTNYIPEGLIYKNDSEFGLSIYTSKSVDLFLIAAGLYMNFDNTCILPNIEYRQLYKKVREHFLPYKDHPFIKNFGKYTNSSDIEFSAIKVLLCHSDFPQMRKVYNYPQNDLYGAFRNGNNTQEFIEELMQFYKDSNAEEFFTNNEYDYASLRDYIKSEMDDTEVSQLIKEMENYVGNKEKYFRENEIEYNIVLTFYRAKGSFHKFNYKSNKMNFTCFNYAYKQLKDSPVSNYSMKNIISVTIHEYLHNYINEAVYNENDLILKLSQNMKKEDYAAPFYSTREWNRIVDENLVRAVEGRIYKKLYGEDRALKEIINLEIEAGFPHVRKLYDKLAEYEDNRDMYQTIDDFMPEIVMELFNNN